ncbi:tetratricopeptide repeat protein [Roseicyclus amphidinii]|jgi:Flp pilus assembly protein TadD|uniref:tetratricopeptide repeat protein n=1 Tax=Roseicyclus amphidinii TaxID=3034232 RepID=UPI0024E0CF74|nr:tetratricopeptide repeat protein [Roseicyclus sp. Amp-Y-6]
MTETTPAPVGLAARFGLSAEDLRPNARHAKSLRDSGRAEEALRIFATLVLAAPEDVGFQLGLADSALATGRPEVALQAAAAAIAFDPKNPVAFLASGLACLAMDEPALAREDLADALRLSEAAPASAEAHKAAGRIAARLLAGLAGSADG